MEFSKYFKSNSNFQTLTAGYERQKDWEKNKHSVFHSMESLTVCPFSATSWDMNANTKTQTSHRKINHHLLNQATDNLQDLELPWLSSYLQKPMGFK